MRACRDCVHLEGGIKNTVHVCTNPFNRGLNLVTGEMEYQRTPEVLRSQWNVADNGCLPRGLWWEPKLGG